MAALIRQACKRVSIPFLYDSPTNQQFPILEKSLLKKLEQTYAFAHIKPIDHHQTAIRICTSWATREEDVRQFIADLHSLME